MFGKKLSMVTFFEAPTVARMASLLESGANLGQAFASDPPFARLVLARPCFFCGLMPLFRALMLRLPEDQPVFAVSVLDTSTLPVPYRLEDLAAHYLEVIRKVHPVGPCAFFGWCRDGVLAYEMAQQVFAQHGSTPLVVMVDSFVPAGMRAESRWAVRKERVRYHFANISALNARQSVEYTRQRFETIAGNIRAWSWRALYKSQLRAGRRANHVSQAVEQITRFVVREYRPRRFEGRVLLLRARKRASSAGAALGWRELVPDLQVVDVPGNHTDIFLEPNVEVMANAIDDQLLAFHRASGGREPEPVLERI